MLHRTKIKVCTEGLISRSYQVHSIIKCLKFVTTKHEMSSTHTSALKLLTMGCQIYEFYDVLNKKVVTFTTGNSLVIVTTIGDLWSTSNYIEQIAI